PPRRRGPRCSYHRSLNWRRYAKSGTKWHWTTYSTLSCGVTYERNGVSNLFMFFAPLLNWRHVKVTDQRTAVDWAQCMQELVDVHFPDADKIVVVQDNLNTHTPAALYAAFAPEEAKRIWDRLEFHYTPKHGSWLN